MREWWPVQVLIWGLGSSLGSTTQSVSRRALGWSVDRMVKVADARRYDPERASVLGEQEDG